MFTKTGDTIRVQQTASTSMPLSKSGKVKVQVGEVSWEIKIDLNFGEPASLTAEPADNRTGKKVEPITFILVARERTDGWQVYGYPTIGDLASLIERHLAVAKAKEVAPTRAELVNNKPVVEEKATTKVRSSGGRAKVVAAGGTGTASKY